MRGVALILLAVELRIAGGHHRRHGDADQEGVAAGRRQRLERFTIEGAAGRGVGRLDERRCAGHRDGFLQRADFEHEVEGQELLRADADAGALVGLEAGERGLDRVGAGRDRREVVLAGVVGGRLARHIGRLVDELNRNARNDAVGVPHRTSHTAREGLGGGEASGHDHHQADDQCLPQGLHGHLSL